MDDALVEKVARAISSKTYAYCTFTEEGSDQYDCGEWEEYGCDAQATYLDAARAVLALPDLRLAGVKEGLEMAATACDELADTAAIIQCAIELHGHDAPRKALQRETAETLAKSIRSLGPRP